MKSIALLLISAALLYAQTAGVLGQRPAAVAANGRIVAPRPPVSFDCGADGTVVNGVTGEPIVRARVVLTSGGTSYSASTDSSGKWTLTDVGCAPAQLQVTRTGFLIGVMGKETSPNRTLQLVSGSPVHGLRTELVPQSVVVGRVLDDQGDPVSGMQVTALLSRVVEGRLRFQPAGSNMANDIGEYRIANLQRGKYIFCVHANGRPVESRDRTITADTCYPGPIEGGAASAMDVPAGRESKVDFNLNQIVPVHIRGSITGLPEGRGIGLNLISSVPNADLGRNFPATIRDGQFDFRAPPGAYVISGDYFEAGKRLSARVPVNAGSSDVDNIVVHLDPGFVVSGVIRTPAQSAVAVPQFPVNLRPSEPGLGGGGQFRWDADHTSFMISDVVPGTYRLQANPPRPFYIKSATLAGQDILNNAIQISQTAGPIEITLGDDGGSVEGDVADTAGQPAGGGVMLLRGTTRVAIGVSQAGGHFKMTDVPPGDYIAYAWDEANEVQYAEPDWMRRYATGGVPVTVTAGQNAQIKLTQQRVPAP